MGKKKIETNSIVVIDAKSGLGHKSRLGIVTETTKIKKRKSREIVEYYDVNHMTTVPEGDLKRIRLEHKAVTPESKYRFPGGRKAYVTAHTTRHKAGSLISVGFVTSWFGKRLKRFFNNKITIS